MSKQNQLEKTAQASNLKLRKSKDALILKVPVPILYTNKGLVAQQSTVDFTGVLKGGLFIAYDAKETENKTSFPLANIEQHQLIYLEMVYDLGGIAFFLIHFKKLHIDKVYITPVTLVSKYWNGEERKSIPITEFKDEWLTSVDSYIEKVKELINDLRRSSIQ